MGDRILIRFEDRMIKSPLLYSHWDGLQVLAAAVKAIRDTHSDEPGDYLFTLCNIMGKDCTLYNDEERTRVIAEYNNGLWIYNIEEKLWYSNYTGHSAREQMTCDEVLQLLKDAYDETGYAILKRYGLLEESE